MVEGSAQKFETLADQSCKLSIYYPRELKRKVLELEGEIVVSMLFSEYQALKEGYKGSIDLSMANDLIRGLEAVIARIKADVEMKGGE